MDKFCSKCQLIKTIEEFYYNKRTNKFKYLCKICWREQEKDYYYKNRSKKLAKQKEYETLNKAKISERKRIYSNNRKKTDIEFKLKCLLRTRLYAVIKDNYKAGSAVDDLGCSSTELKLYLEAKFQEGMNWDNWGKKEGQWSIDHIVPLSYFDLTIREQFLKACHYTNLRPMWHIDNLRKTNKYEF